MTDQVITQNPLLILIDLGHAAHAAAGVDELVFLLVNETRRLLPYRQAALWFAEGKIRALSGVVQPEANAPYAHWLDALCRTLQQQDEAAGTQALRPVLPEELPVDLLAEWGQWLPMHAVWCPLPASALHPGSTAGGFILAGEHALAEDTLAVLAEWLHVWRHAWLALFRPKPWSLALWRKKMETWWQAHRNAVWWRRRPIQLALGTLAVLLFPVRLSVIAQGELVPANPSVIRAPLEGVIEQFYVRPNETVRAGQALFSFDEAQLGSRLEVARQALATAEAEYRQTTQMALTDSRSKGQLAVLLGKIAEKRAEVDFLATQFDRAKVLAPQDGIALFDDPSEWIGKPVQTGERVMRVAKPDEMEIEAWLPIGDAIPLPEGAQVDLYLAASPLSSLAGTVRYVGHDAMARPDGLYAYRVRARLDTVSDQRIGLKGSAKLIGGWVPFSYWVLRRPFASIRQFLAI